MGRVTLIAIIVIGIVYTIYDSNRIDPKQHKGKRHSAGSSGEAKAEQGWYARTKRTTKRFFAELTGEQKQPVPEAPAVPVRCEMAGKLVFTSSGDCTTRGGRLL